MLKAIRETYAESEEIKQLDAEKERLLYMKKEYEEAIWAVRATRGNAVNALKFLKDANDASIWDMIGGGFIADMMKYSSLDKVEQSILAMNAASKSMKKELGDVDITFDGWIDTIDGNTRFFDIAFDNIFTDMNVKNRIEDNIKKIEDYLMKIRKLESKLTDVVSGLEAEITELEI